MSRTIILKLIVLTTLASAGDFIPEPAPTPPALYDPSVVMTTHDVRLAGVQLTVDAFSLTTIANGWAATQVAPGEHAVAAPKDAYTAVEEQWTISRHTRNVIGLNPHPRTGMSCVRGGATSAVCRSRLPSGRR